ncbi:MAG: hypothetical protein JW909_07880 [Planctomycetes bacterium]|nr:hypothetical protein [Planctomycetota bacterium]
MTWEAVAGVAVLAAALAFIGVLLVWSFHVIDRIADGREGNLREIMRKLRDE